MTPEQNIKLLHTLVRLFWQDGHEALHLYPAENGQLLPSMMVNDVFAWGCADLEEITLENIDVLIKAYEDVKAVCPYHVGGKDSKLINEMNCQVASNAGILFACRIRQQRPFKYKGTYPVHQSVYPLIEAIPVPDNDRNGKPMV